MSDDARGFTRALLGAVRLQARASSALRRGLAAIDAAAAGLVDAALSPAEKSALGVRLYDQSPRYRALGELFDWEARWFDQRLPAPGARVFVGAAGAGREVHALLARGFAVDAIEPAPSLAGLAAERCPGARIEVRTYEQWTDERAIGGERVRYDAVILGWGSLSHVLDSAARAALVAAADAACPDGPILASFWPRTLRGGGRARAIGQRAGAGIAALRGTGSQPCGDVWQPDTGFVHGFDTAELEALATRVGRRFERDDRTGDYPHGTFLP